MKSIKKTTEHQEFHASIKDIVGNIITTCTLSLSVIIAAIILYQSIFYPDKIPNIFGYKIFIILDENMEKSLDYGDLIITKNIQPKKIVKDDVVAYRNMENTVSISKIVEINNSKKTNKVFEIKSYRNLLAEKKITEDKIEGILRKKIPKVGLCILIIQKPIVTIIGSIIILLVGLVAYYIAGKLDERDYKKSFDNFPVNYANK